METQSRRQDALRERELLRYYQPTEANAAVSTSENTLRAPAPVSSDITLTAIAQLTALRLDASRAMISFIGKDTQYFIAEATKTLNLVDNTKFEQAGDGLWCEPNSAVSKNGRLCEQAIQLPSVPGGFACFTVTDLSQDERFRNLPFVAGPPYFRFYAGTPLTSPKGINIGSLFILDDKARSALSHDQKTFMGTMAQVVVKNLEMNREAEERKKVMQMSRGLNAFVEGHSWLPSEGQSRDMPFAERRSSSCDLGKESIDRNNLSAAPVQAPIEAIGDASAARVKSQSQEHGNAEILTSGASPKHSAASEQESDSTSPRTGSVPEHRPTFARAANILRQSLDLGCHGGVVFMDAAVGFHGHSESAQEAPEFHDMDDELGLEGPAGHEEQEDPLRKRDQSFASTFDSSLKKSAGQASAKVLGYSTHDLITGPPERTGDAKAFTPCKELFLQNLLKRYPRGKVWTFDGSGSLLSSDDEDALIHESSNLSTNGVRQTQKKRKEAALLQEYFPKVRQILFAPLWDAAKSRWFSGCFCWTTSTRPVFSDEAEGNFLVVFGNSFMAEVSRLATITADQQKGDFIGSISHELRSPLHGIVASAEFLGETSLDGFQTSLLDTIGSCSRTLLDTINHVLDFSKINSFERSWRSAKKPRLDRHIKTMNSKGNAERIPAMPENAPPLLNIYAVTDVAAICEEVVEGVYAGQVFNDISSPDLSDITPGVRGKTSSRGLAVDNQLSLGGAEVDTSGKHLEVVLDIREGNYTFITQPGALRRVIMNVFGNALKYTVKGIITIRLELLDPANIPSSERRGPKIIVITVTDTGKGISSDYLKTRLYTPFAQENTLGPGTGLGLSIVRSIINMLGGSIDIRSEVGHGTEVKISLPLTEGAEADTPKSTPSSGSLERPQDNSISILKEHASGRSVGLYGFKLDSPDNVQAPETGKVLHDYVSRWFNLNVFASWYPSMSADVIIVDEKDLADVLAMGLDQPRIVVLCSKYSRFAAANARSGVIEFLTKPFGPYKLARALRLCLEKARIIESGSTPTMDSSTIASPQIETVISELQSLELDGEDETTPIVVYTNGTVTAAESANAHKATDNQLSAGASGGSEATNVGKRFPFPVQTGSADEVPDSKRLRSDLTRRESHRPEYTSRKTEPETRRDRESAPLEPTVTVTYHGKMATTVPSSDSHSPKTVEADSQGVGCRPPRILLVDDNKINLRLLQTFMKKRKYKLIESAENGLLAVEAVERQKECFDVIFMDISMPVMDGFEATRGIRDIESKRRRTSFSFDGAHEIVPCPPALIIALTGLASSRDQSEAFQSGVDIFMTKPVSFKEVGRLLDNWEANGGNKGPVAPDGDVGKV